MANDFLGGLSGLMKGFSGIMPQDDPSVKLLNAQNDVNELKMQEEKLYAEIGRKAVQANGMDAFGEISDKLKLVQRNLANAQTALDNLTAEKESRDKAEQAQRAAATCPSCRFENPAGTKFCQECGTKLGATKTICVSCGAELTPGTRFCGECGARQPE